jgi:hypothetical protein
MAQFDSLESLATLSTELLQFRKYPLLQRLALSYKIAEDGVNELAKHPMGQYGDSHFLRMGICVDLTTIFFITDQVAKYIRKPLN